jgi:hypothetical protein
MLVLLEGCLLAYTVHVVLRNIKRLLAPERHMVRGHVPLSKHFIHLLTTKDKHHLIQTTYSELLPLPLSTERDALAEW